MRRVVGPDDQSRRQSQRGGASAGGRGEREDLDAAPGGAGERHGERVNGARGKLGVGVGLDLELEHETMRRGLQQVVDEERRLAAGKPRAAQLAGRALVRPALKVGAER